MRDSIRVEYVSCGWHECDRLWVRHNGNKSRKACSRACGQALRQYQIDLRRSTAARSEGLHDTELCAWWKPPYCNHRASKRDLCGTHYARAHAQGELPPTVPRRPGLNLHPVKVDAN